MRVYSNLHCYKFTATVFENYVLKPVAKTMLVLHPSAVHLILCFTVRKVQLPMVNNNECFKQLKAHSGRTTNDLEEQFKHLVNFQK